jgi:hypothetical protein
MGFFIRTSEAGLKGFYIYEERTLYFGSVNASKLKWLKNADDLVESINGFKRGLVVR